MCELIPINGIHAYKPFVLAHQEVPENARRGSKTTLFTLLPSVRDVDVMVNDPLVFDIDVSMLAVELNQRRWYGTC